MVEDVSRPAARSSIVRTSLLLLPMQIVFRGGEAVLPLLLAAWFGRSELTDVYYFAWAVFAFAGSLIFSLYHDSALIPVLAEVRLATPKELPRVTGSLLAHTLAIGSALSLCIGAFALGWFRLRYDGPAFTLASRMIPPFCVFLVALSIKTFFVAILNSEHHFAAYPVASSIGVTVTIAIIFTTKGALGMLAVPIASLAGELAANAVLSYIVFGMCRIRMSLSFARPEPVLRFARLIASDVGGQAVTRINPVVDQLMAGLAGVIGGGTLLRYTSDLSSLPTSLLQASLLPVLLSHLSDDFAAQEHAKIRHTVTRALWWVCGILIVVSLALFLVRAPLLRLVFLRGGMDAEGVARMARLLPYHLVGLAPFGALLVLARAHVAMKNTSIMIGMGVMNASLNLGFNVVLLRAIGLEGIALSTSGVHLVIAVVFWFLFESKLARSRRDAVGSPAT